jgi:ATP-dependent Clp protease ATP-binding subunit ClpA
MSDNTSRIPVTIIERALAEVRRRDEAYLSSEHLLIAVAQARPLQLRGIDTDWLRSAVERVLGPSVPLQPGGVRGSAMPSSDASAALQRATCIAERAGHMAATEDDLLLAMLEAPVGAHLAAVILQTAGHDVDAIRTELIGDARA